MQASEFCYWLQGFFEIRESGSPVKELTGGQVETIQRHLSLVFVHDLDPKQVAAKLQAIHDGEKPAQIGGTAADGTVYRC